MSMSTNTVSSFLSGDFVYLAVSRWLDERIGKPAGFRRAKRIGAERAFIRIGRYNKEQGDYHAWDRAFRQALWHQRHGSLCEVNRFSYP